MTDSKNNTGTCNTGDCNAGDWNTGNWNTGNWNAGNWNTGNSNTGNENTGNSNTGNWNTGDWNTGDWNTGDRNTGNCNTGNWNTGNWNTGYCNTVTPKEVPVFNKPCSREEWTSAPKPDWMYIQLTKWIVESDMTEKEKEASPSYITTGGYLKFYSNPHHAYIEAWDNSSKEDKELTFKLPNFDIEVFKEIFGFTPTLEEAHKIIIDGK